MLTYYYGHYDYWDLNHPVTFDGTNKIIFIAPGITTVDVGPDLYSNWKEWVRLRDNSKYLQAMRVVGGDPTVGGRYLGSTYFLTNGWRIKTWDGDHTLTVNGNLYTDEGTTPFLPVPGYSVSFNTSTSNLVDIVYSGGSALTPTQDAKLMSLQYSPTLEPKVDDLLDINKGNWEIVGTQMVFYRRNGTELMRFDLIDKLGQPTDSNVFKRVAV